MTSVGELPVKTICLAMYGITIWQLNELDNLVALLKTLCEVHPVSTGQVA